MTSYQLSKSLPANHQPITVRPKRTVSKQGFIDKISHWSWIVLFFTSVFQGLYFPGTANFVALGAVAFAWYITTRFFLTRSMLSNYPLSSFLILGFASTQFFFPVLFTTIELKPVVYNLELPYEVFFHSTAALLILMISHGVYRTLTKRFQVRTNSLLKKAGLFSPPSELQMWVMGLIGITAALYVYFTMAPAENVVTGETSDKFVQGLIPFAYTPFLIPLSRLYGNGAKPSKHFIPMLIAFTVLLFIVSLGRNSRGLFMLGFTSIGFSYALGLLLGFYKPPVISLKVLVIAFAGLWLITGPLSDLGTAMVIVRGQRKDISKSELIDLTLKAFQDKGAIMRQKIDDKQKKDVWDERYLDNIFTARFSNLKYNDASLVLASQVGEHNPEMFKYSMDYIWGVLPSPVLAALNPSVNKELIYSSSFGDYFYSISGAGSEVLGGFRLGHFAGTGMAAFGLWYLLILGLAMIPAYMLFDKLALKRYAAGRLRTIIFSPCGLLVLTSVFQFLPSESVIVIITFLIRGWIQTVLLYIVLFNSVSFVTSFFKSFGGTAPKKE